MLVCISMSVRNTLHNLPLPVPAGPTSAVGPGCPGMGRESNTDLFAASSHVQSPFVSSKLVRE